MIITWHYDDDDDTISELDKCTISEQTKKDTHNSYTLNSQKLHHPNSSRIPKESEQSQEIWNAKKLQENYEYKIIGNYEYNHRDLPVMMIFCVNDNINHVWQTSSNMAEIRKIA